NEDGPGEPLPPLAPAPEPLAPGREPLPPGPASKPLAASPCRLAPHPSPWPRAPAAWPRIHAPGPWPLAEPRRPLGPTPLPDRTLRPRLGGKVADDLSHPSTPECPARGGRADRRVAGPVVGGRPVAE